MGEENNMKLRRLLRICMTLCLLTGCAGGSTAPAEPEAEELQESAEPSASADTVSVHWVREPDLKLDGIYELEATPYWGIPETTVNERRGYPQEWDDTIKPEYVHYMEPYIIAGDFYSTDVPAYTSDAIAVISDGAEGIYDYSGNEKISLCIPQSTSSSTGISYHPGTGFGFNINFPGLYTGILNADFTGVIPGNYGGVGGEPGAGYYIMNGQLYHGDNSSPVTDGTPIADAYDHNCLVKILSSGNDPYTATILGYAVYDAQGKKKKELEGLFPVNYYVNGFSAMSTQANEYDRTIEQFVNKGQIALYNMNTCEPITDAIYTNAKYFESGFCPVEKDGKWGFIDETGNEVTDFIFDDASSVYEGKAFVGTDGVYGVIDLARTVSDNIPITMDTCYPNGIPEGKTPEHGEIPFQNIGTAQVKVDNLNTRSLPSTDGEKLGIIHMNSNLPVFEISKDDKYTWYRISDNAWIADQNGEWVEFKENWKE